MTREQYEAAMKHLHEILLELDSGSMDSISRITSSMNSLSQAWATQQIRDHIGNPIGE